ncbi:tRNA (N(6)-L-threonylcarbamoyladenosine(37)-C(2))-methylthiotransferase MtaB [Komagataeibacter nataicola]|uniref:tRNA (N(6)-L-threonylcarbamoyladenosine(37)-C(2))-methylthiotransferase MtaB n=1 Tax=Komagataeibacter nataicola TaxID=265960 RepID=A0A9N7H2S3_9PROT|nr:tRNA (N(6)-L-threonylcarbamoyladenosine(37)-C(2))-methylthiotransferase MtaB [Komagataeibacter nataicola]AQU88125.1 tRNA (N(6)-L-threonylcarbamoyladenosine(37)-C(2))-methylthiotransferase MtaB [Komagataeibacter nataicola]PYD66886.1 tRNA (N(6)-L-threonylcarbamoyladenosine(37)-C(2))-methylthiotransferase MtaB [Komagataeibacter nataicola]WEQ54779.1 tRNA (N(6)-L-threonylcarbamoyladenosine(37)-C(2))-methylthiotransferase MtaB [Komagataeibacter nataicola]GBR20400.1 tRNA 2-methylthioadenosine synth
MTKPEILTFGCRLNTYESEVMRNHAAGLDNVVIVNTCAVTGEAERQARQAVRRAHRERPDARIVVTGCAAQIDPERWAALPGVTRVLGNREKLEATSWSEMALGEGHAVSDIMAARETAPHLVTEFAGRTRAFVEVQQGCDHRCTFCIIPFGRGPSRSVPVGAVVEQVRALVHSGYREVVLTGVDITSWGHDLPGRPLLGQLCRRLLALVPELERLRLSSVDPVEIDEDIWKLLATEPRFMPYLHLSLQAGSDIILKRMKRRHLTADAAAVVARARALRSDIGIGADIIAGFPTEDDALFEQTLEFVRANALPYLHVFPYSERPGTPAARMPAIAVPERKARAARLRAAGAQAARDFHERLRGRTLRVLMETDMAGHSEEFAPVRLVDGAVSGAGRIETVRPVAVDDNGLVAEIL